MRVDGDFVAFYGASALLLLSLGGTIYAYLRRSGSLGGTIYAYLRRSGRVGGAIHTYLEAVFFLDLCKVSCMGVGTPTPPVYARPFHLASVLSLTPPPQDASARLQKYE